MPGRKPAFARGFVVTTDCIGRQRCRAFRISTSEHYIFRLQRILQMRDNIEDVLSPFLLSESLQSRSADVLFETSSILVRKVSQIHRFKDTVDDQPDPAQVGPVGNDPRPVLARHCHIGRNATIEDGVVLGDKSVVTDHSRL